MQSQATATPKSKKTTRNKRPPAKRTARPNSPKQKIELVDWNAVFSRVPEKHFNAIHSAIVESVGAEGAIVSVKKEDGAEFCKALLPSAECSPALVVGNHLKVYLADPSKDEGQMPVASIYMAKELGYAERLKNAVDSQSHVTGHVIGPVKGGYSVVLFADDRVAIEAGEGVRAFLPGVLSRVRGMESIGAKRFETIECQVKEFDRENGGTILSMKEILLEKRHAKENAFWEKVKLDDVVEGPVVALTAYGAFLDIEGVRGFLHISDMSWDKPRPVAETLHVGKVLQVKVIEADKEARRLKVGLKQMRPDPWKSSEGGIAPGTIVHGVVVAIADFGAFVKIADGMEGLIHVSEISWNRIRHPSQRFHIGDEVDARVLHVEKDTRRIALSTKALEQNPIEKLEAQFPIGAVLKTRVVGVKEFGVFVALGEGVSGLVHIGELSWTKTIDDPANFYKEGDEVEVVVLGYDAERQRVSCSIKRTKPNPWTQWKDIFQRGTVHVVTVTKVTQAGAECELAPDLIGFCPARELVVEDGRRAQDAVKVGDKLDVLVVQFDPADKRVLLSVKAKEQKEVKEHYQDYLRREAEKGSMKTTLGDALKKL
jgi:small subunit ribosomal protein S1